MLIPDDIAIANRRSLSTITRAITLSEGQFALILVRCNYESLQRQMWQTLQHQQPQIQAIALSPSISTLYTTLKAWIDAGSTPPLALAVFGLESVTTLDSVLLATNQVRDEFRRFPFPLILWVTDEVLTRLARFAPDFRSWAATSIKFELTPEQARAELQQTANQVWADLLNTDTHNRLDLAPGSRRRQELQSIRADLQAWGIALDPVEDATWQFILAQDAYRNNQIDAALSFYQDSLKRLLSGSSIHCPSSLIQGILLYHIGLCHCRQAGQHPTESLTYWQKAREFFQSSLEIFEEQGHFEWVAQGINQLAEVLQQQKAWAELETLALKALINAETFNHPLRLAQAYGFLARVALSKSVWQEAETWAQTALFILSQFQGDEAEVGSAKALYLLLKGKAQRQKPEQILLLEQAREELKQGKSEAHPQLQLEILDTLNQLYFQQRDYRQAFQIKQEQRSLQSQYGFDRFSGVASQYLSHQQIAAAGRQLDVERLLTRLSRNDRKLTIIHGSSGVGKSSLIHAGLIPTLTEQSIGARDAMPIAIQAYHEWERTLELLLDRALAERGRATPETKSGDRLLQKLQKNSEENVLTVLIFDQFEELFSTFTPSNRSPFYNFLAQCLDIPFLKIILSIREDYLHCLLEIEQSINLEAIENDILNCQVRYPLSDLSPQAAKRVIRNLFTQSQFHVEDALIDVFIENLAGERKAVRLIEMQLVGSQLQAENIRTLKQYQQLGSDPKNQLISLSLASVIADCGEENADTAWQVLYALTNERGTRPPKTRADLAMEEAEITAILPPRNGFRWKFFQRNLTNISSQPSLDLILEILLGSGLVCRQPDSDRYQLVHDYLVKPIRDLYNRRHHLRLTTQLQSSKNQLLRVRQQRQNAIAVGVLMTVLATSAIGFAWWANVQRKLAAVLGTNARLSALSASSEALYASHKEFDALLEALRATKLLKQSSQIQADTRSSVVTALEQAVYGVQERDRLTGHKDVVWSVSFSPDGQLLASAGRDNTIRLWHPNSRRDAQTTLTGHQGSVTDVAFSPDGQILASSSEDKTIRLWRRHQNGFELHPYQTLRGHKGFVYDIAWSHDGQTLASASGDGTVKLWQVGKPPVRTLREARLLQTLNGRGGVVNSVAFSSNGQILASGNDDKTIKLWRQNRHQKSYTLYQTLLGHQGKINALAFTPSPHRQLKNKHGLPSPTSLLASASDDKTIKLWKRSGLSYKLWKTLTGHMAWVMSVAFSANGEIASGSADNTVKLWSPTGRPLQTLTGHSDRITSVAFSPKGEIASASYDKTIKLWQALSVSEPQKQFHNIPIILHHQDDLYDVTFSPDSRLIATASRDKTVKIWRRDSTLLTTLKGHSERVYRVSFSPDAQLIATASRDKTVKIWRQKGQLLHTLIGHQDWVLGVAWSPNGYLATASRDGTVKLWSADGRLIRTLVGHTDRVNAVSFSPDGQYLVSASDDRTVKLWQVAGVLPGKGEIPVQTLRGHTNWVLDVAFSPDSKRLATASYDNTVKLWQRNDQGNGQWQLERTLQGFTDSVARVAFSPDGEILATTSWDNQAQLWRLNDTLVKNLVGHSDRVTALSWSPDGRALATASNDNTVRIWNFDIDDLQQRGCLWLHDYLQYNPKVRESDRRLCDR